MRSKGSPSSAGEVVPTPSLTSAIKNVLSVLTLFSGLLLALGTMVERTQLWVPWIAVIPKPYLLLSAIICVLISLILQRRRFAHKSEMRTPQGLSFDVKEHLIGRDADILNILKLIASERLIWLIGESGVGKSSLAKFGLAPKLETDARWVPYYIDNWGSDWDLGAVDALADAVKERFPGDTTPRSLSQDSSSTLFSALNDFRKNRGRTPVLIFDQIDDYQSRNRDRFIVENSFVRPDDLIAQNSFWKMIHDLLARERIKCVLVARSDSAAGLESLRLALPRLYSLNRLAPGFVLPLLEELTNREVISHPESGWNDLRRELAADLERSGSVLPIQLRIALTSLSLLPSLTLRDYRRSGGLLGLEVSQIQFQMRESARSLGISESEVRSVLLSLVNADERRSLAKPESALLTEHPIVSPVGMESLLTELESKGLVRKRIERDVGLPFWTLDHDYLSQSLLESQRRAARWQDELNQAKRSWDSADSTWRRFRTLLSPSLQVRILIERLRGRLLYGSAITFALWSTIRLALSLPVILTVVFLIGWHLFNEQRQAEALIANINPGKTDSLDAQEPEVFRRLAGSSLVVRREVLRRSLTEEGSSARIAARTDYVMQAVVGIDVRTHDLVSHDVEEQCSSFPWKDHPQSALACSSIAKWLRLDSERITTQLANAITGDPDPNNQVTFAKCIQLMAPMDNLDSLQKIFLAVAHELPKAAENASSAFADVIPPLATRLDKEHAQPIFEAYLTAMETSKDGSTAAQILLEVAEKVDPSAVKNQYQRLYSAFMTQAGSYFGVGPERLERLADRIDPAIAQDIFEDALRHTPTDTITLGEDTSKIWAAAFAEAVASRVSEENKVTDAKELISQLQNKNYWTLKPLTMFKGEPGDLAPVIPDLISVLRANIEDILKQHWVDLPSAEATSRLIDQGGDSVGVSDWSGSLCQALKSTNSVDEIEKGSAFLAGLKPEDRPCSGVIVHWAFSANLKEGDEPIDVPWIGKIAADLKTKDIDMAIREGLIHLGSARKPNEFGQDLAIMAALPREIVTTVLLESKVDLISVLNDHKMLKADDLQVEIAKGVDVLPQGQLTGLFFSLTSFLQRENALYFNQRYADVLFLLAPHVSPSKAGDALLEVFKVWPHTQESLLEGLDPLSRTAVVLARETIQDDVERCYSASVNLIGNLSDYEQVEPVVPVAIELGQRLAPQAAKRVSDRIWDQIARSSTPYPIDEFPRAPRILNRVGDRTPTAHQMLDYRVDILAGTMTHLPDYDAAATVNLIAPRIASWPIVPCQLLAPLTRNSTVTVVLHTLAEPTCDPEGRDRTITALGLLKGGPVDNSWDVLRWAERQKPTMLKSAISVSTKRTVNPESASTGLMQETGN